MLYFDRVPPEFSRRCSKSGHVVDTLRLDANYDDKLASQRPKTGFESHAPRRLRLEHEALSVVFKDWDTRTKEAVSLYWGGKILRKSKVYLAATVVDHPQLDKFAGSGESIMNT